MSSRRLLLGLSSKYPFQILLNVLLGFSGAIFNGVGTALIVPVLLSLLGQQTVIDKSPEVVKQLLLPFTNLPAPYAAVAMSGAIISAIVLKNAANYANNLASGSLSRKLTSDLQEEGLNLLLEVDLDFFCKTKVGDLVNRLGGEMNRATVTITSLINLLTTSITALVFGGLLLSISWQLTLIAAAIFPLSTLLTQWLVQRSRALGRAITDVNHQYSSGLVEILSGIRLIKSTKSEAVEYHRFQTLIRQRETLDFEAKMSAAAIGPLGETFNIVALFVLVLVSRMIFADQISALSTLLLTYLVVLSRMLPIVSQLNSLRANLARAKASVEVVDDLLRRDNKTFMVDGSTAYQSLQHGIRVEQVSFHYPGNENLVIQDVELFIPKGKTLALVGASGAGKSTLADLLLRFYDPTQGQILIDGRDLRDISLASYRRAVGVVSQDSFLFNDTIRNNIAYGFPDVSDAQIVEVAKRANAYEFITQLPSGLETRVGDRGVMLSGGQRQRIAIARALLRDPEILILDEATSALDSVSEHLVQQAIEELSRERTTVVIAHRLSTIRKADQIAVLDNGKLVELGTHDELLKHHGPYARFCSMQFSRTSEGIAALLKDYKYTLAQTSFESRARLNAMLGSLSLLSDGLADTPQEYHELAGEAYDSALELFQTVRRLENATSMLESELQKDVEFNF